MSFMSGFGQSTGFYNPKTKNTISTEVIKTKYIISKHLLMAYFYDIINNIDRKLPYYCFSLIKQHPKIISIKSDFIKAKYIPFHLQLQKNGR